MNTVAGNFTTSSCSPQVRGNTTFGRIPRWMKCRLMQVSLVGPRSRLEMAIILLLNFVNAMVQLAFPLWCLGANPEDLQQLILFRSLVGVGEVRRRAVWQLRWKRVSLRVFVSSLRGVLCHRGVSDDRGLLSWAAAQPGLYHLRAQQGAPKWHKVR